MSIESGQIVQNYRLTRPTKLRSSVLCSFFGDGNVVLFTNTNLGTKNVWFVFQVIVLDQAIHTIENSMEQTDDCKKYARVRERCKFSYSISICN
jgi:hypothetical protein